MSLVLGGRRCRRKPPGDGEAHADEAALGVVRGTVRYMAEFGAATEKDGHEADEPA